VSSRRMRSTSENSVMNHTFYILYTYNH
jgi:hypothetical protein